MAGDVWRWCQVHQKWLQDANVKVTRSGLENDRTNSTPQDADRTRPPRSFRNYSSRPGDCLDRMSQKPSGTPAAASSRWQDNGWTLDPVPPTPWYANDSKGAGAPSSSAAAAASAALRSSALPTRPETALGSLASSNATSGSNNLAVRSADDVVVEDLWPKVKSTRPVRWLFAETPVQKSVCRVDLGEGENWVTVFSSNPVGDTSGGGTSRFGPSELHQVLKEFEKCGTIVERVVGPDGANWVQIQFQSSREAGQALMKSGLRLKGGLTVIVRSLDKRQRKQLLLETISSKNGTNASPGQSSSYLPLPCAPVDLDARKEEEKGPPKSSVSKFVDLVFDCERDYQIAPAGYIIPIRFQPGLYKELFKSQIHRCDDFVTPLCDPAATQPLHFEYPRTTVDPCEYAQSRLEELRNEAGEDMAHISTTSTAGMSFRPSGAAACGGTKWRNSDFSCDSQQQRYCGACRVSGAASAQGAPGRAAPPERGGERPSECDTESE